VSALSAQAAPFGPASAIEVDGKTFEWHNYESDAIFF
jgi:hypothetical protein